jgi:hypothetical protein
MAYSGIRMVRRGVRQMKAEKAEKVQLAAEEKRAQVAIKETPSAPRSS